MLDEMVTVPAMITGMDAMMTVMDAAVVAVRLCK